MDWAEDLAGISDEHFSKIWKYAGPGMSKSSTVIRITAEDEAPVVFTLKTEEEWRSWFESDDCKRFSDIENSSSLFLILAKRDGEPEMINMKRVPSDKWLAEYKELGLSTVHERSLTFASLAEKEPSVPLSNGQRKVRVLPFSETTFRLIARKFYVHDSISAIVSRADIPAFSSAEVEMQAPDGEIHLADVYNCRSTNAWELDLALTVTHFPRRGLTFGILLGCPLSIEKEIIQRLSRIRATEAGHPLVLPGIFAELERSRHVAVSERMIDQLEGRIYELEDDTAQLEAAERLRRHQAKREDYLDTAYLMNGLVSWKNQLAKMADHVEELQRARFEPALSAGPKSVFDAQHVGGNTSHNERDRQMRRTGQKVLSRLQSIIDEYDAKIRDCTMRLDGMAMATQWAQGETNVDIALATSRDSKHMRSIALVTMVFLPGTFFAGVFSMDFFTWTGDDGSSKAQVSDYLWVYILFTVASTAFTIGLWYYFNIWRQPKKPAAAEEFPLRVV